MNNSKEGGSNTPKDINAKFLDHECNANPGITSAQLLATIKQHVSSTPDDLGQECEQQYPHRIIFMAMMKAAQQQRLAHSARSGSSCDSTARFRPSCWIFVGPGSENNKKLPHVERTVSGTEYNRRFFKETKSEHPVVRGTTLFDQGTLRQKKGKESIQFNASLEPSA